MQTKHPLSLKIFFTTEMWERYGFYVVQTLLALYLALHFKWPDKEVYALVGSFTALTYLSPVMGGWLADHFLGQKRSVLLGAVFLFLSYVLLTCLRSNQGLCLSLAGIVVGSGLLKPNISSLLGNEYLPDSPYREHGFIIFYMGLTTGILLGTTLPSYLNEHFGWPVAFLSAAIGMVFAFTLFAWGIWFYKIKDYSTYQYQHKKIALSCTIVALLWIISFYILHTPHMADAVFLLVALIAVIYVIYSVKTEAPQQARQTMVIGILCLISVVFWAFYFQMFLSFTLFILRAVQPTLGKFSCPPPYYVALESLGMILLGFLMIRKKRALTHTEQVIHIGNQFTRAMLGLTFAYGLIVLICQIQTTLLSPWVIMPTYLIISYAELLLSPVGLAAMTLLASRNKVSTMMGIFFVSLGIGGFLAGKLANITALTPAQLISINIKAHYAHAFLQLFFILAVTTMGCVMLNRVIKGCMRD